MPERKPLAATQAGAMVPPHKPSPISVASIDPSVVDPKDEELRREAAEVAGVDVETLPKTPVLAMVVKWLFSLLVEEKGGLVAAGKIKQVCTVFDEQVPMEGIDDTLAVVDADAKGLNERQLYVWVVLMFGDCTREEFQEGVNAFGEAASKVKGSSRRARPNRKPGKVGT